MKGKIAVEGIERDIVPVTCQMLEETGYEVCYRHESPYRETVDLAFRLSAEPSGTLKDIPEFPQEVVHEEIPKENTHAIRQLYERNNYEMVSYKEKRELLEDPSHIVKRIAESGPDLAIICNANGYLPVLTHYSETTDIPLLVVTGGGPGLIDEVKGYTPHVLEVPFKMKELHGKLEEIFR